MASSTSPLVHIENVHENTSFSREESAKFAGQSHTSTQTRFQAGIATKKRATAHTTLTVNPVAQ